MLIDVGNRFDGECETPARKDLFIVGTSKEVDVKER